MEQQPPQGMAGEWRPYWLSGQALCRTSTGAALRGGGEKQRATEKRNSGMTERRKQRKGKKKRGGGKRKGTRRAETKGVRPLCFRSKHKVIDVSVDQINAHTDITTSYTQRKTGRNVTHLNFKINAKEAAPKAVKRPSLTRAYVEKHALPGESWEVARERLRAERGRA
jgi:hypothetical protein